MEFMERDALDWVSKLWLKYGDGLQPLVDAIEGKVAKAPSKSKKAKAKEDA